MNILQFGYGRYGKFHLKAWEELGCEVVVYDPKGKGLDQNRPNTQTWQWADLVDIVTPADTHFNLVVEAWRQGKPVFCEKPLTTNPSEAKVLAKASAPPLYVGYGYRFAPGMLALRDSILYERPTFLKVDFYANKEPRTDTNLLWSDGVHCLDLLDFLTPGDLQMPRRLNGGVARYYLATLQQPEFLAAFEVANNLPGHVMDPVIRGDCLTTKRVIVQWKDGETDIVTFSSVAPVSLLKAQFNQILNGTTRLLATAEESYGLTQVLT